MPLTVPTGSGLDPPSTAFPAVSLNPDIWPHRGIAGSSKAGALLVLCVWESHTVAGMLGGAACSVFLELDLVEGHRTGCSRKQILAVSFCTSAEHHE